MKIRTGNSEETRRLGAELASALRPGDLVLLHGQLGAGKTTFTQGLASGMGVEGRVVSPTFIVTRVHQSRGYGPDLIHVDAYRIEDDLDLETLDLDSSLESAVTVVEWGAGKAEVLNDERLEIFLRLEEAGPADWTSVEEEQREIEFIPVGKRWKRRLEALTANLSGEG